MEKVYVPEGGAIEGRENRGYLSSLSSLERAMQTGAIIEGLAVRCDEELRLFVDLGCARGVIEAEECVWCREGEDRKDIAIITRVGKPVACKVTSMESRNGELTVKLSRRQAQKECMEYYMEHLRAGHVLDARVTHMEPFGAFLDIGCGVPSLLSVDSISVSRISHPRDRLAVGMRIPAVVKYVNREGARIYTTLRELLGTWEENASAFEAGQTVTGIIRSVESYGVFVELAPNLAGLAEVRESDADALRERIGESVAVYIKSIVPERMKIKLVLIDPFCTEPAKRTPLRFFSAPEIGSRLTLWRYSPDCCQKSVETRFEDA